MSSCAVGFFVRQNKKRSEYWRYLAFLCRLKEKMQSDGRTRHQPRIAGCCLNYILYVIALSLSRKKAPIGASICKCNSKKPKMYSLESKITIRSLGAFSLSKPLSQKDVFISFSNILLPWA
jgi:hypothetical protein